MRGTQVVTRVIQALFVSASMLAGNLTAPVQTAAAAPTGHLTGATVSLSTSLSSATEVTYTIDFTTSPTGALAANTGFIDIEGPAGAFPGCAAGWVTDLTTKGKAFLLDCGAQVGGLHNHLRFTPSEVIHAGDRVEVVLNGVNNPAKPGVHLLKVGTSSDSSVPVAFQTTAPGPLSALSLSRSDDAPGATQVAYTVDFTASPGGALVTGIGTVDVTGPPGTFPTSQCLTGQFTDLSTNASAGLLECGAHVDKLGAEVRFAVPVAVGGGDRVAMVLTGLTNPKTPGVLTVATSSDTARSVHYSQLAPTHRLSEVSVILTSAAVRATRVTYTVEFTTSTTGGLAAGQGTITVDAAIGTFPEAACHTAAHPLATVSNLVTKLNTQIDLCTPGVAEMTGGGAQLQLVTPVAIGGGQRAEVVISGLDNPGVPGPKPLSVFTSSDGPASATYTITGKGIPITALSVELSTARAKATRVTYTFKFTPSPSGGLAAQSSGIQIDAPPGTFQPGTFCSIDVATATNLATNVSAQESLCSGTVSDDGSQAQLLSPVDVAGGQPVELAITGLDNPVAPGAETLSLSTTSNTAREARYSIVRAVPVNNVSVALSNPTMGAGPVTYAVGFAVPADGGLAAGSSTITLRSARASLPSPTECGQGLATVSDLTSGVSAPVTSCLGGSTAGPGSLAVIVPIAVRGGDRAVLTVPGIGNPAAAGPQSLSVATSSDGAPVGARFVTSLGARISGSLHDSSGFPVPNAEVQACPTAGGPCLDGPSGTGGAFEVFVPDGHYVLSAYPPARASLVPAEAARLVVVDGVSPVLGANIALRVRAPIPGGVNIDGQEGGTPVSVSFSTSHMAVHGCRDGIGDVVLQGTNTRTGQKTTLDYLLAETPFGSGYYTATIPPVWPVHGPVDASYAIYCSEALLPNAGLNNGGNTVFIYGEGFTGVNTVTFGAKPAKFTVLSPRLIEAVAPPGKGTVNVAVRTPHGATAAGRLSSYTYIAISLAQLPGPSSGGTTVEVKGSGLRQLGALLFGSQRASLDFISDYRVYAVVPPGHGKVPVAISEVGESAAHAVPGLFFSYGRPGGASAASVRGGTVSMAAVPLPPVASLMSAAPARPATNMFGLDKNAPQDPAPPKMDPAPPSIWGTPPKPVPPVPQQLKLYDPNGDPHLCGPGGCSNLPKPEKSPWEKFWIWLFDPSGTVFTTTGAPVPGATVVLQQAPTAEGPFTPAPGASPGIEPHINPEITGPSGKFHWDVIADYYKVVATAPGCHAPGDPARASVATPVMEVPPPRFGLVLVLSCARAASASRPQVTGLSRNDVARRGGTSEEVIGAGFTPSAKVMFGASASPSVTFLSPELLAATVPPGRGHVNVRVSTSGGISQAAPADVVTYLPGPTVASITPSSGPPAGGTRVAIRGSGFTGTPVVELGGAFLAEFTVVSPSLIVATVPANPLGTADITVTTDVGTSPLARSDRYTYAVAPWLAQGQTGLRSSVPWAEVGTGWALALAHGRGVPLSLFLVDPSGGRYMVASSLPAQASVADWSANTATALILSPAPRRGEEVTELSLRHGSVTHRFVSAHAGAYYSFSQPAGAALLDAWRDASGQFHLSRTTLAGEPTVIFPNAFPRPSETAPATPVHFTGTYLQSPDGTTVVLSASDGMAVVSRAGKLLRDLYVPTAGPCLPLRWWQPGVILSACRGGTPAAGRYWLVPISGTAPMAFAPMGATSEVWDAGGALYGQGSGRCGTVLVLAHGKWHPATLPGTLAGAPVEVVGAEADQLLLLIFPPACTGSKSAPELLWSDPTTDAATTLFGLTPSTISLDGALSYSVAVAASSGAASGRG